MWLTSFLRCLRNTPQRTLFDNIHPELVEPEETDRIRPGQYISFFWSGNDCLYDVLFETVDNQFQECGVSDEPIAVQLFDSPKASVLNDLAFEEKLFELIDRLCKILIKYDHE